MSPENSDPPLGEIGIRHAVIDDSAEIARLANLLSVSEGLADDVYDEALIRREAFAADASFRVLVGEPVDTPGRLVAYLSYTPCFNTDLGRRGYYMIDLYVDEAARRRNVARNLIAAMATIAQAANACSIEWGVRSGNEQGLAFYAALGARDEQAKIMSFDENAIARLAEAG